MISAAELITDGGPSAPAWAFFSAISLALIAVLGQQLKARSDAKANREALERVERGTVQAVESATAAQENTTNVSNGFVGRMDRKLDRITDTVEDTRKALRETEQALREHLEWHLDQKEK